MYAKCLRILAIVVCCPFGLDGAENEQGPLQELEAKIHRQIAAEKWNKSSGEFLKAIWQDYKNAHLKGDPNPGRRHSIFGKMPEAKDYDSYLGQYARSGRPFIEIVKTDNHFFVIAGKRKVPAAPENGSILFTTGDVVYSELPRFAQKPYAALEMYRITLIDGQYHVFGVHERPSNWVKLDKTKR